MPKIRFLEPQPLEKLRLRYIEERDLELLRVWKNKNKKSFFYQKEISPKQQREWFLGFLERHNDYMFMVELVSKMSQEPIGCMGFRVIDNVIDVYNVIRDKTIETGFTMGDALHLMLNFVVSVFCEKDIVCMVLADNPAISWYQRNGFTISKKKRDHFIMLFNKDELQPVEFEVS
jgi:RimJ/RimL family protein N-acetyltransferase